MRALVTGAAGFLGSHLAARLLADGHDVVGVDNFATSSPDNIRHIRRNRAFGFVEHDVTEPMGDDLGPLDAVLHLASPASPVDYLALPIETLRVGSVGTERALELAVAKGARFLLASTSEVYGDPQVHPQPEDYWGYVNPVGQRAVYDEAKRFAEALTMTYHRARGVLTRIARIFNTYGPGMRPRDGRVVSNFVVPALRGEDLTVYGDGLQTRSFCYVDDTVEALWRLVCSDYAEPVNVGNSREVTVRGLADLVLELTGSSSRIAFTPLPADDQKVRCPDIARVRAVLGWEPQWDLRDCLLPPWWGMMGESGGTDGSARVGARLRGPRSRRVRCRRLTGCRRDARCAA